ncbi:MAG: 50S ribosomal protein L18a [Euryarchaeota archaeon]|nr:50S ribosomal protein L18a [Euryarchaeota archaeon]
MAMKAFRVSGKFKMGHSTMNFIKEYALADRKLVEDKLLAELGSKHRVKRRDILIEKVEELAPEDVEDGSVRQMLGRK